MIRFTYTSFGLLGLKNENLVINMKDFFVDFEALLLVDPYMIIFYRSIAYSCVL